MSGVSDFLREVSVALSKGYEVKIRTNTRLNRQVDIEVLVAKPDHAKGPLAMRWAMGAIAARDINQFGVDTCYVECLKRVVHHAESKP